MHRAPTGKIIEAALQEGELNLIQKEACSLVRDHQTTLAEAVRICRDKGGISLQTTSPATDA